MNHPPRSDFGASAQEGPFILRDRRTPAQRRSRLRGDRLTPFTLRLRAVVGVLACVAAAVAVARDDDPQLRAEAIAPGAYVVAGRMAAWGPDGHGQVANSGFIVGARCVAVIDGGGSAAVGRGLLAAIRQVSALPVCYVINTHAHPDHVLGNAAFAEAGSTPPRFVAHRKFAAALAARAPYWLKVIRHETPRSEPDPALPAPTLVVDHTLELDLGERVLELRAWPTAHTDNDLTVWDGGSATLWLGDLAFIGHLPVLDGRLRGWRDTLQALRSLQPAQAVPGHGPVIRDWPAGLGPTANYLAELERDVRAALREGLTLAQTVERLGARPDARLTGWELTEVFHRRNVTAAYAELEWSE